MRVLHRMCQRVRKMRASVHRMDGVERIGYRRWWMRVRVAEIWRRRYDIWGHRISTEHIGIKTCFWLCGEVRLRLEEFALYFLFVCVLRGRWRWRC